MPAPPDERSDEGRFDLCHCRSLPIARSVGQADEYGRLPARRRWVTRFRRGDEISMLAINARLLFMLVAAIGTMISPQHAAVATITLVADFYLDVAIASILFLKARLLATHE